LSPSHTARYQSDTTIHYPFHPRHGERVEVLLRHRFRGAIMFVVRQTDGTQAQIPVWMCAAEAAAMAVRDQPRLSLAGLRDLRFTLDTLLSSLSGMERGERDAASTAAAATRRPSGADGAGAEVADDGAGGGDTAVGGASPSGGPGKLGYPPRYAASSHPITQFRP
jgi:hypothetical protein